ncbi:dicarboxylate/amino acid:cation symporter [Sharpea azabuensis]|uniref:Na+/H+-dicarboxylate symporter n=1 Tax=Sharpea azabuensis TaxID=322505 RepID=A0A1H6Q0N9_9FIRM|nr:dicarboxylate/amino acid:cation symporter [Sharpea azabuensis]HAJ15073.1 dicarboxylate/amino acid:cation symporter [Erysipelotrichaceae bacterium]MDD6513580.1 dicarboxylate/amino acid:cation symporter [Sharpea azabuensis]SEI37431.1 Na+/H+-dicarboxylate symporter [Sharpea azabuensis]HAV19044.1 dicarboxylate/amino acid:cation symporter [Erysipelotrichaceae bacterium]HBG84351.1 dicarboxylate/amino acid:cation symporter [Erysipelotrichaceae bacterium]
MKKEKKIGLTTMIFIALILGAVTGVIINLTLSSSKFVMDYVVNGAFYIVGQGFIRGMQMLVVPLVFCSIVCGAAAIGDTKTLGKVGLKTVMFYMATTVLAVTLALGVANVINPGKGANLAKMMTAAKAAGSTVGKTTTSTSAVDTILNIIPTNPIQALANGDMLAIIFFALLIGIILAKLGERVQLMTNFFSQGNDIMMEMTMMVMKVAPIAVYCLIARTFSSMGFSVIIYMLKYVIAVLIALLLQGFGVYQILLFIFTRLNPFKFIKKFFPVMAFAFSTATSNATIPLSIETLEEKIGVSRKISSFTIPLGATVNMDGTSIMQGVAVVFVAQAYGITLTPMNMLTVIATATLASIGTAGVPSVGLITLTMVFNSVGLPAAGITLIMGIDRILDMARTAVNITGDAVCTTIVAYQNDAVDKEVYNKAIPNK